MSSEVKLIVQNDLKVNVEEGRFTLKLATEHPQGRGDIYFYLGKTSS